MNLHILMLHANFFCFETRDFLQPSQYKNDAIRFLAERTTNSLICLYTAADQENCLCNNVEQNKPVDMDEEK